MLRIDDPADGRKRSVGLTDTLLDDLFQLTVVFPGLAVRRFVDGSWRADFLQQALFQDV